MTKFEYSKSGLWFTKSHKGEQVTHLFRLGTTTYEDMKIYEIIVGKFRLLYIVIFGVWLFEYRLSNTIVIILSPLPNINKFVSISFFSQFIWCIMSHI